MPTLSPEDIAEAIFDRLMPIDGVISVSLVGSICLGAGLESISDIDTVVVCHKLDARVFEACNAAIQGMDGGDLGVPGAKVHVNAALGPLKFDAPGQVVVHLMIYDVAGHRRHVLKSPFTCYDWERTTLYRGPHLSEIYPVLRLQPRDLLFARRGMQDYLRDLEQGVLSYRRYDFSCGEVREVVEQHRLDSRHGGEYAYHIVKFLVLNFAKIVLGKNVAFTQEELIGFWEERLSQCAAFIPTFCELETAKRERTNQFPARCLAGTRHFLDQFYDCINVLWEKQVTFIRHGQTALNDGGFLGQGRDPSIADIGSVAPLDSAYEAVYASPLLRTVQTAERLCPAHEIKIDARLTEIDYGLAEGLAFSGLAKHYPEMVEAWSKGDDPPFPEGENTASVLARLEAFLKNLKRSPAFPVLVVTHNVVLRCLLGSLYGIPLKDWHRIPIEFATPYSVQLLDKMYYPNLGEAEKAVFIDGLTDYKNRQL